MINDNILSMYEEGKSLREIGEAFDLEPQALRRMLINMGLAIKKKDRKESMKAYSERSLESSDEPIEDMTIDRVSKLERALLRSRADLNHYKSLLRADEKRLSFEDRVEDLIQDAMKKQKTHSVYVQTGLTTEGFGEHTSALILSDLHFEESVSVKDVGCTNEYTWEIAENRLSKVFGEWLQCSRGERDGKIFMLGDFFSGVIHDTLENTTKPIAEAIADLADILTAYVQTAATIFPNVEILYTSGNHERLSEYIKSANKGFDLGYLFAKILEAKIAHIENVGMCISTNGLVSTTIGDKVVGGHHGDMFRRAKSDKRTYDLQEAFKNVLGVDVYHIFEGHTHKFSYHNTNRGASICNGSLIGSNAYGHTNGFVAIRPSQTVVLFDPTGEIELVKQVFVDG